MESTADPNAVDAARGRRVQLALPRFDLSAPGSAMQDAPAVGKTATPLPPVASTPTPAARAHGNAHAHAPTATATPTPKPSAVLPHAHAHAHSHAGGACEESHGLFNAHQHDWSHLAMQPRSRRMLKLALAVQAAFLLLTVVGGLLTNSLALLGDAAHMLADVGALGLALLAASLAARAVDARRTWGMPRAEMLAAAFNSLTLVVSCGWIAFEAIRRLIEPEQVAGRGLIAIAFAGLLANLFGAWLLANADRDNVNIRAAMLHLLLDAASSVGVIIAGIVIVLGGPVYIDTIASLLIVFLAVKGTWPVLRSSLDSLVDAAPPGVDANDVIRTIASAPGVRQVHDVHVWEPGPRRMAATAHVLVDPRVDVGAAILELRGLLRDRLGIDHATLQVAPDRRTQLHEIDRVLPRDAAIERAVNIVAAARPTVDRTVIRRAVELRAPAAEPGATAAPVRLVASAIHDL
jgi:cobalt-zinc-cadmium efflux system protein